jgi:hypothetical protein
MSSFFSFDFDKDNIVFLKFNDTFLQKDNDDYGFPSLGSGTNLVTYYMPEPIPNSLLTNSISKAKSYGRELDYSNHPSNIMPSILKNVTSGELNDNQINEIRYLLTTARPIDLAAPFSYIDFRKYETVKILCSGAKNINGIIANHLNLEGQGSGSAPIRINRLSASSLETTKCKLKAGLEYNNGIINCNIFKGNEGTIIDNTITLNCSMIGFLDKGTLLGIYNGNLYLDRSDNSGIINGDAYFGYKSTNYGVVNGKAHFEIDTELQNSGQVNYIL